mgnify:CR=1 FL=1
MAKTLEQRVAHLEAENKELRNLWIENEGDIIEQKVRLDNALEFLGKRKCFYNFKRGWWCSREGAHSGPCALRPKFWNIPARLRFRGM